MRNVLVLSAVASVLSFGISAHQAGALSPGIGAITPEGLVQNVQKSDEKGGGARDGGGKGPGAVQDKGSDRAGQDKGDRGAQRSGDKATRGQKGTNVDVDADRGRRGERGRADRRTNVDVDVRGGRGDRGRVDRRTRVDIDVDRRRRARGRDVDVDVRSYGYRPGNCQDILRRYRQCIAR